MIIEKIRKYINKLIEMANIIYNIGIKRNWNRIFGIYKN